MITISLVVAALIVGVIMGSRFERTLIRAERLELPEAPSPTESHPFRPDFVLVDATTVSEVERLQAIISSLQARTDQQEATIQALETNSLRARPARHSSSPSHYLARYGQALLGSEQSQVGNAFSLRSAIGFHDEDSK